MTRREFLATIVAAAAIRPGKSTDSGNRKRLLPNRHWCRNRGLDQWAKEIETVHVQKLIMHAFQTEMYVRDQMDVQDEPFYDTTMLASGL